MGSRLVARAFVGALQWGHLSEKWPSEPHTRQRLFCLWCSFPSGSNLPSGPRTLEKLGFFDFDELAVDNKGFEVDLGLESQEEEDKAVEVVCDVNAFGQSLSLRSQ